MTSQGFCAATLLLLAGCGSGSHAHGPDCPPGRLPAALYEDWCQPGGSELCLVETPRQL